LFYINHIIGYYNSFFIFNILQTMIFKLFLIIYYIVLFKKIIFLDSYNIIVRYYFYNSKKIILTNYNIIFYTCHYKSNKNKL